MPILIQIALGGALGAVSRHLVSDMVMRLLGASFPFGTLFVNIVGSFALGAVAGSLGLLDGRSLPPWAPILTIGFLGGFTTFSTFSLDVLRLVEGGALVRAGAYCLASVGLSLVAVVIGLALGRLWSVA